MRPNLIFFLARCVVSLWLGMACLPSFALEIGPLRWLPQPDTGGAHAEVLIADTIPVDASSVRARVATPEAYVVAGLTYHASLMAVRVSVREAPKGQAMLWIEGLPQEAQSLDLLLTVSSPVSLGLAQYHLALQNGPQTFASLQPGASQATTGLPAFSAPDAALPDARAALDAWAQAWRHQDVDAYLAAYTADYAGTPVQASRSAWVSQRRMRIMSAKNIAIALQNVQTQRKGSSIVFTFVQHYRSDQHTDNTRKRVVCVLESGRWRIQSEVALADYLRVR